MSGTAILFLVFAEAEDRKGIGYIQLFTGLIFAAVLPTSRLWPESKHRLLALQGILICILVPLYCFFMWYAMNSLIPNASSNRKSFRVSHAPGVLAIALAYGLRMAYDFGLTNDRSRAFATKVGGIGLFLGGVSDLFVLYFMFTQFSSW